MSSFAKTDQGRDATISMQALKRVAQAEDIAPVIAFLASEAAHWVTGEHDPGRGRLEALNRWAEIDGKAKDHDPPGTHTCLRRP